MKKLQKLSYFFIKLKSWNANLIYKFHNLSAYKHLLIMYLIVTFLGAGFLMAPFSQQKPGSVSFIDALFVSASAFSDTGLVSIETYSTWTYFGQAIIAILILNGGIGLFSLKIYIINILFSRPISYNTNLVLSTERGSVKIGISKNLIKISITLLIILTFIFSFILTIYFYFSPVNMDPSKPGYNSVGPLGISPYMNWGASFRYGLFHTISAINNAGFDIIGPESLLPYYFNYGLQFMFIILFVIGGIGYPVIYDLYLWIKSKFTKEHFRWSLFTKLSMITYVLLSIIGFILVLVYEMTTSKENSIWLSTNPRYGSAGDKIMAFFFNTMSTRNAGYATVSIYDLAPNTQFIYIILMFIGSAPSSTAGGIRTTTIAIIVLGLWNRIRGRREVRCFERTVSPSTVERAYIVFLTSIILTLFVIAISITSYKDYGGLINKDLFIPINSGSILATNSDRFTFMAIIFEVSSAFGTTGLSLGITKGLSISAKTFLILLMFIGQLGISSTILVWGKRNSRAKRYSFVHQDIIIG